MSVNKPTAPKNPAVPLKPADAKGTPATPPLFRRIDWVTFGVTTLLVFIGYWLTLAPDMTLEDSGELAVASMYAGVPHPPGYPVWTIYTWLFTLLPIANIAYRVALSSAVAGALSCGLVALMVSRGSSMMIEGIADLKNIERRRENALCVVSGFVAGMLLGFNGFMWSQAVIVEVYTLSLLSLAGVLVCLLRWIHAPHQRHYLYLAFFWFGITFNNHQSLLVTALGIEVAVLMAQPRLGRDLFFWNFLIYLGGLVGLSMDLISVLKDNTPLLTIYHLVGITSGIAWIYLVIKTKKSWIELGRDLALVASLGYVLALFGHITSYVTFFEYPTGELKKGLFILSNLAGLGCIAAFIYLVMATTRLGKEWLATLISGGAWLVGAAFYVYMPLASMSNPPLNWGYPRTVTGFFHAFTRGQYERIHPTTGTGDTAFEVFGSFCTKFAGQIGMYIGGAWEEFNFIYVLIGLIPFFFYRRMQARERAWLIGLTAIYLCLSFFLLILLAPASDRQSRDLNKVFFTASHVMIAMGIGYGLTLIGALLATQYERYRRWALVGFAVAAAVTLYVVAVTIERTPNPLVRYTAYYGFGLALVATLIILVSRARAPLTALMITFAAMPIYSIMSHWEDNEQHGHLFGYWFGHDMFTPPFKGPDGKLIYSAKKREEMLKGPQGKVIYPEMTPHTVLFGGTDPGRFNPTYMIFCESFIPRSKKPHDPDFDRRDVYLITQNALADGTYLQYIRAHYNRSTQIDPPFFQELLRGKKELEQNISTNFIARAMIPIDRLFTRLGDRIEKKRRAGSSFFKEKDFTDLSGLAAKLRSKPDPVSKFLFDNLSKHTQDLVTKGGADSKPLRAALAKDLNRLLEKELTNKERWHKLLDERTEVEARIIAVNPSAATNTNAKAMLDKLLQDKQRTEQELAPIMLYTSARFAEVPLSKKTQRFIAQNPRSHTRIRLNRLLLEEAYPAQIAKSLGGVYPDLEINTPSNEDSQRCFQEYLADAQRRLDHDRRFPNEPRQIRPGEDVKIIENRVQVSGQVAVMAINGLLTKIIFDENPDHEFFVEESFPLEWMYPYITPFGIIMKINRQPLPALSEEILASDHEFWSSFSERLIGNWITYDTSVSNVCAFAEKVYYNRDYSQFKGDPKFVRDSDGQKAFSKLRSSIGGVYGWRLQEAFKQGKTVEYQRMLKEAEFAFKQAYAFCPYSPEAVFRFVNVLIGIGRTDEAQLIAATSKKLDPFNSQLDSLVRELDRIKAQQSSAAASQAPNLVQIQMHIAQLEQQFRAAPTNMQLASQILPLLDQLLNSPQAGADTLLFAAHISNQLGQMAKVEQALAKLVKLTPDNAEAWFDLAGVQALLNKTNEALTSLRESLQRSGQRLARDTNAANLHNTALTDSRFSALRSSPGFQKIIAEQKPALK